MDTGDVIGAVIITNAIQSNANYNAVVSGLLARGVPIHHARLIAQREVFGTLPIGRKPTVGLKEWGLSLGLALGISLVLAGGSASHPNEARIIVAVVTGITLGIVFILSFYRQSRIEGAKWQVKWQQALQEYGAIYRMYFGGQAHPTVAPAAGAPSAQTTVIVDAPPHPRPAPRDNSEIRAALRQIRERRPPKALE